MVVTPPPVDLVPLFPGACTADSFVVRAPLSFWGGVDPTTGKIVDPRHPDFGRRVTDKILLIPDTVGSSSSSAILLELLRNSVAPAGIILGGVDAILVLGNLVAQELGVATIPMAYLHQMQKMEFADGESWELEVAGSTASVRTCGRRYSD
ncbi:MAG: DUF126 domain-containing protein [Gemmatimonadota bacterium]|nr:DUF126 domain-containing protein [Gemmatimonadota bacterium]